MGAIKMSQDSETHRETERSRGEKVNASYCVRQRRASWSHSSREETGKCGLRMERGFGCLLDISWEILSKKPDARRKRVMKTTWEEVDAMHQDTDDSSPIWWQWFIILALGRLR